MEHPGVGPTRPGVGSGPTGVLERPADDAALDAPPALATAEPLASRRHVRTQASGKGAIAVVFLAGLMWLVVNSQALMTLAAGLVLAVVADGWLARRALAADELDLLPVGDAVAGDALAWTVRVPRLVRPVTMQPAGDRTATLVLVADDQPALLVLPPIGRGVVHVVDLDLRANGPIGLCRAARRYRAVPSRPRIVGPVTAEGADHRPPPSGVSVEHTRPTPRGDDQFRGVRPYRRGDDRRKVHWKATARAGETMVREEEGTGLVTLQVIVDLDRPGADAEEALAIAVPLVDDARRRGWMVQLVTLDATPEPPTSARLGSPMRRGPVAGATSTPGTPVTVAQSVHTTDAIRRQLATAAIGTPIAPPWPGLRCRIGRHGPRWST